MSKSKLKTVKRAVKHVFTSEEVAQLNVDFRQSFATLKSVEAEFDSVKASYKAKTTEAESRMESLNATLQAGFDIRDQDCVVIMDFEKGKKYFFLASYFGDDFDGVTAPEGLEPAITEQLTDEDRQQELIEAERRFECREEITLFPRYEDGSNGILVVGRLDGKWYSALRVELGEHTIDERLDSYGPGSKKRYDQVKRGLKQFEVWLDTHLGREEMKGFKNQMELLKAEHAEREE